MLITHIMLLRESGRAFLLIMSEYPTVVKLGENLRDMKYNKISQLGSLNGGHELSFSFNSILKNVWTVSSPH